MKLKTIFDYRWKKWHRVFLWRPQTVILGAPEVRESIGHYRDTAPDFMKCRMWLCFVERKYMPGRGEDFYYFLEI